MTTGGNKVSANDILQNVLLLCHGEGLLAADGIVPVEVVFRRFTAEVFRQYRQNVRLREFQTLMGRSSLLLPGSGPDCKEYQIDVRKILAEKQPKSEAECKENVATAANPFLSSIQNYSLIHDEAYLEKVTTGIEIMYVITVSQPKDTTFSCLVCRENFRNAMGYLRHITTHGSMLSIQESYTMRRTKSALSVMLFYDECQLTSTLKLVNLERNDLIITGIYIYHKHFELFPISLQMVVLKFGNSKGFMIQNQMLVTSPDKYSLLITYSGRDEHDLLEQYYLRVYDTNSGASKTSVPNRFDTQPIKAGKLGVYLAPKTLSTLVANNFQVVSSYTPAEKNLYDVLRAYYNENPKTRLNASNYTEMLELLIHIQDLRVQLDMSQNRADDAQIIQTDVKNFYRIDTAQFTSLPTSLAEGDIVQLIVQKSNNKSYQVEGTIAQILYDHIIITLKKELQSNCHYNVKLKANRIPSRLELQALDMVRRHELAPMFFPSEVPKVETASENLSTITSWINPNIVVNAEQQAAIRHIVNRTSDPLPYILFGPPGTGKTTTIVEAIVQICRARPTAHILVAAQSNSACDELAVRLMNYLTPNKLFRFYSRSSTKNLGDVPQILRKVSNLASGEHQWPTWKEVYGTRVLICSLSVCGRLVQSKIRSNHFDFVFIDECGSATEPAALLAIAGLVSAKGKFNASIVLAGDPYQLGPVIRSELAAKMGLGMSMLERMMNLPVYQKDPTTKQYNNQLITKLVKNFRSHELLMKFSNEKFYDSELSFLAPVEEVNLAENWRWLPNKKFPIILHTVFGSNERSSQSKSIMNQTEIDTVEFYLDFLLKAGINDRKIAQEEIGIISPYQLQVQRLKQMCLDKQWPTVEIGSVEQFQGREKLVMIVSTARSHTPDVGFLNNVKRLNVALTRAKALLIIVGNSNTLQKDPNWFEFINYCTVNGAIVGRCFGLDAKRIVKKRSKHDAMFDSLFTVLV